MEEDKQEIKQMIVPLLFVSLPIEVNKVQHDDIDYDSLGLKAPKPELETIIWHVNVNHIVGFNEDSRGEVTLYTSNDPNPTHIPMKIKDFITLLTGKE